VFRQTNLLRNIKQPQGGNPVLLMQFEGLWNTLPPQ
jgi:hypothetical protein